MSSGVVADRPLTDLYLNGAKVPILVTNHRSNCTRIQSEQTAKDGHKNHFNNQPTNFIYGSNVTRYNSDRDAVSAESRRLFGNNTTLPSVETNFHSYNNNSSVHFPDKQQSITYLSENEGIVEITSFPPARQTSSLVTIVSSANGNGSRENQSFGNLGHGPVSNAESSNDEDGEAGRCRSKSQRSADQSTRIPSCADSRKENLSPHPPSELQKKKVKRKRKVKNSKQKRFISIKKGLSVTKQSTDTRQESLSQLCPSTAPAVTQRTPKTDPPNLMYHYSHNKPSTAHSTPNLPQSFAQRQEVCRSIYIRQGRSMPSRARTLPTVSNHMTTKRHSMERTCTSSYIDVQPNVLRVRLSESTGYEELSPEETVMSTVERAPVSQRWSRLIKIYLSEKQSGSLRDVREGTEYPCAPPATPTPDQLQRYSYVPSMTDVKAQRKVKNKLHALERAEQKKMEKQRGKREKAELQVLLDNTKVLKQRQRLEIYALNAAMTECEYNRFVGFCLSHEIDPS